MKESAGKGETEMVHRVTNTHLHPPHTHTHNQERFKTDLDTAGFHLEGAAQVV